jgi:hypothetical protein
VQIGFYFLIGAIGISPALIFLDSPLVGGLLVAYTALSVAIVGFSIRPGEAGYLTRVIRPLFICALLPAAWMIIQTLPVPTSDWAHPIWISAQAALNRSLAPSMAIDRGAALVALVSYCFAASVIFLSAAVTIDRSRADYVLLWLAAVTTFSAILGIALEFDGARALVQTADFAAFNSLSSLSALGVLVNVGASDRAVERYETRRSRQEASFGKLVWTLSLCLCAFVLCAVSVIVVATTPVQFATAVGLTTFCVVIIVRRLALGPWVNAVFALTVLFIAVAIIATNWGVGDVTLQFASHSSQAMTQVIESMLADTRWMGNGAGGFGALLPIYQDIDRSVAGPYAPTTAATIAIELGRPALYVLVLIAVALLIQLLHGALRRGRDSFYPTVGAGCIVLLIFEAFCDSALLEKPTIIIAGTIIGLALAQSVSRTNQTG